MIEKNLKIIFIIIVVFIVYCLSKSFINKSKKTHILGGNKEIKLEKRVDNDESEVITKIQDLEKKLKIDNNKLKKKEQKIQNILQNNEITNKIDTKKELKKIINYKKIKLEDFNDYKNEDIELWNAEIDKFMPSNKELDEWEELFTKTITIKNNDINKEEIPELEELDKKLSDKLKNVGKNQVK